MTQRSICSPGPAAMRWLGAFGSRAMLATVLVAVLIAVSSQSATHAATAAAATRQRAGGGHEYRELRTTEGRLRYALGLPDGFDRSRTYPVLLAFPPGPQTEPMVDAGFNRYWGSQASRRGWIVVSPAAPDGQIFHRGGDTLIPALLDHIASEFQIEGGRFHVAGWSNGGRTAFHVALEHPSRVRSLVVLPGGPPTENDAERLGQLEGIPVRMFAGGRDTEWIRVMQDTERRLTALGVSVESTVLPGEGHVPPSLDGERIMTLLEGLRESGVG
jgi:poly(3-hydroxybutyrate) depolymerase